MRAPIRALALAVASAVFAGARGGAAGDVGVAIVRGDGRLQPLAALGPESWTPLAASEAAGPWHVWLLDDPTVKASPFSMRSARTVTAAAAAGGACLALSGLEAGVIPPPPARPKSPIALALRGTEARPDVPVTLAAVSDLGVELATKAAAAFHRAEDEILKIGRAHV